jgi:tetratricopeptide (TPR) repeat protein
LSPRKPATARVTGRREPFDSPLTPSPSTRERLAQDGPVQDRTFGPRPALGIFAIALTVRLVHVWQLRASPFFSVLMGDSRGYDEWALRIARGDWIGSEVFYQAPLYPYFLGVIYATAGRHLLLVRIIQAVIGSASCALLGLAAARLFSRPIAPARRRPELVDGRRAGIAAGLMLALYAPAIFFDGLLQKSVLDVFFVCLALWLIARITTDNAERAEHMPSLRSQQSLRSTSWLFLGLAMGGLALTRENALVFIAVILAWALFDPGQSLTPNPKSLAKRAAVFLTGLAIVLVPVAARNSYVGGGFFVTTSQFGPNFYIGNNPIADGTYQSLRYGRGAPEYERQDATDLAERAAGRKLTPADVSSYWTANALDFITSRPVAWLKLMGRKVALLWNATEMLDTESQEAHAEWSLPLRLGGAIGHFGVLVPLAVFGVMVTWPLRSRLWVLYAMTLTYAASVVIFYVFARYRYPLAPLLILFAAAGVVALPALVRARRGGWLSALPGGIWTLAAVVASAVFANWPILSPTLMRAITETNLGVALQGDGRLDEATEHYHRAIALSANYAPAYNNLATALRAKGLLRDAVATYERAIGLRPGYPEAHYNLANALLDEGKPGEAAEHFRLALQTIPSSADVHNNLGIALVGQGQIDEAIAEFRAALQVDPNSAISHRNLADALASRQRDDEAIDHFREAARLDPADGSAHYDLGILFLERNRFGEAVDEFQAALTADPGSVRAHNNLGIALGSQGKLDEAIAQFRRALEIEPGFEDAKKNLAMALEAKRHG